MATVPLQQRTDGMNCREHELQLVDGGAANMAKLAALRLAQTSEDPAAFDAALLKILTVVLDKPEVRRAAAARIASIADDLAAREIPESANSSASDPLDDPSTSSPTANSSHRTRRHTAPGSVLTASADAVAQVDPSISVLDRLKQGFLNFKSNFLMRDPEHFELLKTGQSPKVFVIACCDSRVSPGTIMSVQPGEVFTLRNVANLAPPWERNGSYHGTSAALEYAVLHLQVEHIIVLGHRDCGGIKALMTRQGEEKKTDFIENWMEIAKPAKERTLHECRGQDLETQLRFCEKESVNNSLSNLLTFPFIKRAVSLGKLQLHGWYYDLVAGSMSAWTLNLQITNYEHLE